MDYPHEDYISQNGVDVSKLPDSIKRDLKTFNTLMKAHSEEKRLAFSQKLEVAISAAWLEITTDELEASNKSDEQKESERKAKEAEVKAAAEKEANNGKSPEQIAAEQKLRAEAEAAQAPKSGGFRIGMFQFN